MIQTLALLNAAYRELNARKLFWVTMAISLLIVAVFAMVGINEKGLSFLWWGFEFEIVNTQFFPREVFYKFLFANFGIGFWLSWLASILALISTASIVPDMVTGGSIDILLSKPIGRTRLFLTRYFTGLLFVTVQVAVFTIASILVVGFRGGSWEPWFLLAIPLVVIFFSYLFCICALVGLLTKSTIVALLVTMLFWLFIFGVDSAENLTLRGSIAYEMDLEQVQVDLDEAVVMGDPIEVTAPLLEVVERTQNSYENWSIFHFWFYSVKTFLPKTTETIDLLDRTLRKKAGLGVAFPDEGDRRGPRSGNMFGTTSYIRQRDIEQAAEQRLDTRGVMWIIGSSLIFEALVLIFCCWRFLRRDF
jgi:ABC-type transport system involved in multi-copper enzyme maturation permease subunit